MNGKQKKNIARWCEASYNATSPEELGNETLESYTKKVKNFWKANPDFRVFMDHSMKSHYLK